MGNAQEQAKAVAVQEHADLEGGLQGSHSETPYSRIEGCTARMFGNSMTPGHVYNALGYRYENLILFAAIDEPYLKLSALDENGNFAGARFLYSKESKKLEFGRDDEQITSELVEAAWIQGSSIANPLSYAIDSLSGC